MHRRPTHKRSNPPGHHDQNIWWYYRFELGFGAPPFRTSVCPSDKWKILDQNIAVSADPHHRIIPVAWRQPSATKMSHCTGSIRWKQRPHIFTLQRCVPACNRLQGLASFEPPFRFGDEFITAPHSGLGRPGHEDHLGPPLARQKAQPRQGEGRKRALAQRPREQRPALDQPGSLEVRARQPLKDVIRYPAGNRYSHRAAMRTAK